MNGVRVKRLGNVVPGETETQMLDPLPIVLWAGGEPAAVLTYRIEQDVERGTVIQELAPIPESVSGQLRATGGGFPLVYRTKLALASEADRLDRPDFEGLLAADVNGDGMDELVVARQTGGADLVAWGKLLATQAPPSRKPEVASYHLVQSQIARIGGRAVVHLLYDRTVRDREADANALADIGAGDAYVLLRIDARGISRIQLTGKDFSPTRVLAVGAINRPGSDEVDELVALTRKDESGDVYASRHRPGGALVDAPRRVYAPLSPLLRWRMGFVPHSGVAILTALEGEPQIFFLEAEKPANWIRTVDLKALAGLPRIDAYLGPAGGPSAAQAVFSAGGGIYAVDAEGTFFTGAGGALAAAAKPQPFYTVKPSSPLHTVQVVPSAERGDELLVVQSRGAGTQALSREQIAQAADRFLAPEDVAALRRELEVSLEGEDPVRDQFIADERARRGVKQPLHSLEEWRKLLPDSYAATVRDSEASLYAVLRGRLLLPLDEPQLLTPKSYRHLDEYRTWLAGRTSPAETTFELVRAGASRASFRVGGELGPLHPSDLIRSAVDWRASGKEIAAVATLSLAGQGGAEKPGIYVLRAGVGGN